MGYILVSHGLNTFGREFWDTFWSGKGWPLLEGNFGPNLGQAWADHFWEKHFGSNFGQAWADNFWEKHFGSNSGQAWADTYSMLVRDLLTAMASAMALPPSAPRSLP